MIILFLLHFLNVYCLMHTYNMLLLLQACIDENDEMVELLLERGANIEAVDNEGWTPLHAAASAGNVDIARYIIVYLPM